MEFVKYEEKDMIGYITINREKALNALNSQAYSDELNRTFDTVDIKTIRCLIFRRERAINHSLLEPIYPK